MRKLKYSPYLEDSFDPSSLLVRYDSPSIQEQLNLEDAFMDLCVCDHL